MAPQNAKSLMEQENFDSKINSVKDISKAISMHKNTMVTLFQQKNDDSVLQYLSMIGNQLNSRLTSRQSSIKTEDQLTQIMKIWTALSLYQSIIGIESQSLKRFTHQNRNFNDLDSKNNKQNYKEITYILNELRKSKRDKEFLSIWIDFVKNYKQREFFKDESVRKVEYQILHNEFAHIVNQTVQKDLNNDENLDQIIDLIGISSGILRFERQVYRNLVTEERGPNKQKKIELQNKVKKIALEKVNFDLIQVIFFESDLIKRSQLRQSFKIIKEQSQGNYKDFVKEFVNEYLRRMKLSKIANPEVRNFTNLLYIFPEQIGVMRKIFEQTDTDLDILFSLREGRRKEVAQKIVSVAQRMKNSDNEEKLLLTVLNLKDIKMKQ